MLTQAARASDQSDIPDIIGRAGVDPTGITSAAIRWGAGISAIVRSRTGVAPEAAQWFSVEPGRCRNYIKQQLGVHGRPVLVHMGHRSHAVVFVGHNGDDFFVHDPQATDLTAIGYTRRSWADLMSTWDASSSVTTLVIPTRQLDPARPEVTVNIMNCSFRFLRPGVGGEKSEMYTFGYNEADPRGYSFRDLNGRVVEALPGSVTELSLVGDVEIINSTRTDSHDVSVWLDISSLGEGNRHHSVRQTLTLAPNSTGMLRIDPIRVDAFREQAETAVEYILTVTALVNDEVADKRSINFTIEPGEAAGGFVEISGQVTGTAYVTETTSWAPNSDITGRRRYNWSFPAPEPVPVQFDGVRFSVELAAQKDIYGASVTCNMEGRFSKDRKMIEEVTFRYGKSHDYTEGGTTHRERETWTLTFFRIPWTIELGGCDYYAVEWPGASPAGFVANVSVDESKDGLGETRNDEGEIVPAVSAYRAGDFQLEEMRMELKFGPSP